MCLSAGAIATIINDGCMTPWDVIKQRMQARHQGGQPGQGHGAGPMVAHCAVGMPAVSYPLGYLCSRRLHHPDRCCPLSLLWHRWGTPPTEALATASGQWERLGGWGSHALCWPSAAAHPLPGSLLMPDAPPALAPTCRSTTWRQEGLRAFYKSYWTTVSSPLGPFPPALLHLSPC